MAFDKCQVGDGLWSVTRDENDGEVNYTIDVPEQLISPIEGGLFEIDALTDNSKGVTQARTNIPPSFGPATITEVAWLLEDGTVYAVTRYAALPVMPPESGNTSEVSLRAFLQVGDINAVTLIVDSGISASREFVEEEVAKVDAKTTAETQKLSEQLSDLPVSYLVIGPVLTGDTEQAYGNNISLAVSGGVSAWHNTAAAATIDHYEWELPDNTTLNAPNITWPVPNDPVLVDTEYLFKVRAIDTEGNFSAWINHNVTVVGNRRPVVTNFSHNVPVIAIKNQVVGVAFSGVTDPDGDDSQITYRITDPVNVVASKSDDIVAGVSLDLTFADVLQNSSAGITVVAIDQAGVQSAPLVITVDLRKLAVVEKPTGLAPSDNSIEIDREPYLSSTPFVTNPVGFDTHKASQIQVSISTDFEPGNTVVDIVTGAVTSLHVNQNLVAGTKYFWRMRHQGDSLGWSDWSTSMIFTTTAFAVGAVLADGSIVGPQFEGHYLVVAPASRRGKDIYCGLYNRSISTGYTGNSLTKDPRSGLENTNLLIANHSDQWDGYTTGPDAAEYCRTKGAEWFLPNKDELKAILSLAALIDAKDTSAGPHFSDIGAARIWTSTASSSSQHTWALDATGAFIKDSRYRQGYVTPVRRVSV